MRRKLSFSAAPVALALLLTGCEHAENNRWSARHPPSFSATLTSPGGRFEDWSKPAVSVYSFATPTPASGDSGLRDLSDRGQAALIAAMTAAGAKPDEIRDALSKPLKARVDSPEDAVTVEGSYKRTLVANVTKGWGATPGERLVWTWIDIRPDNFVFDGYSILATDNQLLNIEQVTNATTAGITGNLGRTGSQTETTNTAGSPISRVLSNVTGSSAGVSGSVSNTYTTTAGINQQYVKLGADIVPEELRIYRESERNLDVAGNTLIALTMRLDPTGWRGVRPERTNRVTKLRLLGADGSFANPADLPIEVTQNEAPPHCALTARVVMYYQDRRPRDGRSYVEGQQEADYTKTSYGPIPVTIVSADEVRKPSWRIYPRISPQAALQIQGPFEHNNPIDFTSYEQAHDFLVWLTHYGSQFYGKMEPPIGKAGLRLSSGVDGQPLFPPPYFVERTPDPPDLPSRCAGMANLPGAAPGPSAYPAAAPVQ